MSQLIPVTQNNATSQSNVFTYTFPSGSANFKNREIALASFILPYSWFNISAALGNNTFSLVFPVTDGTATTTVNVTITDGFYTLDGLNDFLQQVQIANGFYLVNGSSNVYYAEIVPNTTTGLAQFNSYIVPTSLPSGYSNPASWALPSTGSRVPKLVISNALMGTLIGFSVASYPSNTTQSSTYSVQSSFEPQISQVSSILLTCSLVCNDLSSPNNIIATVPINSTYLAQIIYTPNEFIWMRCLDGNVTDMSIRVLDQNGNNIVLRDSNINASFLIRNGS